MLTPTQELFFQATVRGEKPEQAARSAGLKSPKPSGFRMRKHPAIVAALAAVGIATNGVIAPPPKPTPPEEPEPTEEDLGEPLPETKDSIEFLEAVLAHPKVPLGRRMEAAKLLIPFQHGKVGEKGKKESRQDAAKSASSTGRFATPAPPKLVVSNREA